jgi:hypothetical protein
MDREQMRAGDGDRERVAGQLKRALDEGRLDLSEYDERLQKTYSARTYGDLNGLLDDIPGAIPPQHSQVNPYSAPPTPASSPSAAPEEQKSHPLAWLGPSFGIFLVCTFIWLITSPGGYFWPVWTLIPFILGLLGAVSSGGGRDRKRDRKRDRR